jgi:hypothetical protein
MGWHSISWRRLRKMAMPFKKVGGSMIQKVLA